MKTLVLTGVILGAAALFAGVWLAAKKKRFALLYGALALLLVFGVLYWVLPIHTFLADTPDSEVTFVHLIPPEGEAAALEGDRAAGVLDALRETKFAHVMDGNVTLTEGEAYYHLVVKAQGKLLNVDVYIAPNGTARTFAKTNWRYQAGDPQPLAQAIQKAASLQEAMPSPSPSSSPSPTAAELPVIGPDDPFPFGNYDRGPFEEMTKTNERVELPLPTSALFGLEGADAALYEAAVADIYNLAVPEAFSGDDLYLPSLSVIGSYQNEDGETCYVCVYRRYCYDYLAYGLADPDRPQYFPAFDYMPVRITLAEQEGGTLVCSDFLWGQLNGFSGGPEKRGEVLADMLAGPSPEIREKIKEYVRLMQQDPVNGDAMVHGKIPAPDNYRNLTTPDPYELLDIYLGYFFRAEEDK